MPKIDTHALLNLLEQLKTWLLTEVLIFDYLIQVAVIALLFGFAWILARRVQPFVAPRVEGIWPGNRLFTNLKRTFLNQFLSLHLLILLLIATVVYQQTEKTALLINMGVTLLSVWIIIKLASSVIYDRFWSVSISVTAWTVAALMILDVFKPLLGVLDSLGFNVGDVHISILSLIKAGLLLLVTLRLGAWLSQYVDKQLHHVSQLTPSARVLISKSLTGLIYFLIGMAVLNSVGIDFTALAVFGGALGVGIGFGLQKVVSNLISGIILLSDKSIKPGDVIQIGEVFGWISSLKARYVSVVTRDGHEYLIPNEDLITQQVINWSYSDPKIRLTIPFGVSYKADPHQVRDLVIEAMNGIPRVLKNPPPKCFLKGFGDSSVDMEVRAWITDPKNGVGNLKSEILFAVWDTLKANNIEIPFPQRDVHIKSREE
ncbi:MAG: mechanosensitive ion channel [Candidatus Marinimicrobia bacterium]|nr:mechanosensitive ion channel [Candidatus Neomarinimicrobiota bacterium]